MRYFNPNMVLILATFVANTACDRAADAVLPGETADSGEPLDTDAGGTGDTGAEETDDTVSTEDGDNDGFSPAEGDCDDTHPGINPWATDTLGEGFDQNCDGVDGVDLDGDGVAGEESGGTDCDDHDPTTRPGAAEVWYNGHAEGCQVAPGTLWADGDQDGDGERAPVADGYDCDDTDPRKSPKLVEDNTNGVDDNCNGVVDSAAYLFDDPEGVDFSDPVWFSVLATDTAYLHASVTLATKYSGVPLGSLDIRKSDYPYQTGGSDASLDFQTTDLHPIGGYEYKIVAFTLQGPGLGEEYGADGIGPDCIYWEAEDTWGLNLTPPQHCIVLGGS